MVARGSGIAVFALIVVAIPAPAGAARAKHGVRAQVRHRTLTITGNRKANSVTLRQKRRVLLVDVQSNGSADFKFKLKSFGRIVVNGGRGRDKLVFTGSSRADAIALSRKGHGLRIAGGFARASAAAAKPSLSARAVETVQVNPLGGADNLTVGNLARTGVRAATLQLGSKAGGDGAPDNVAVNATAGDDSVTSHADGSRLTLTGLAATVTAANLESGDHLTLNGAAGNDTLHLAGSPAADTMDVSANGPLLHTSVAGLAFDSDDVEALRLEPLAGADVVNVGDLTGTDTGQVASDLAANPGGPPDGQVDSLTVNGGAASETVAITGGPTGLIVSGMVEGHSIAAPDPVDQLTVNGAAGADAVSAAGVAAGTLGLTLRGGPDADTLTGGASDETFAWSPGDGADVVEGGPGTDTGAVGGSDAAENFGLVPVSDRIHIVVGPEVPFDMHDVEAARIAPRGGADIASVPDMTGTQLTQVRFDLGDGDGAADQVFANGTTNPDSIPVTPVPGGAAVAAAATTTVTGAELGLDRLAIQGLQGDDTINASSVPAGLIDLVLAGGPNIDTLIGSQGNDLIQGGTGDDTGLMGAGNDTFLWNPGDGSDIVEGQDGSDRLLFNGANVNENIDVSANGGRLRFTRDIANIVMDCDNVETVDFNAFGGADHVVVNDLTGTDVTQVNVGLAATGGGGDGATDTVTLNGTGGGDTVTLTGGPSALNATGLATGLTITGAETGDVLIVNGAAGDDTLDATTVAAGSIFLTLNGDANNDTIRGSAQKIDTLNGGDGDDTIYYSDGDNLNGGTGANTFIHQ
jgi:hypothetical protein